MLAELLLFKSELLTQKQDIKQPPKLEEANRNVSELVF